MEDDVINCYRKTIRLIKEECEYAPMCDTEFSERVLTIINQLEKQLKETKESQIL